MEIHEWETGGRTPTTIGTFTVYLSSIGLSIFGVKAIRTKKGGIFISLPSWYEKDDEGGGVWKPHASFSEQRSQEFQKKCLEAIEPFLTLAEQNVSQALYEQR